MTLRPLLLAAAVVASAVLGAKPPVPPFTTTPSGLQYAEMRLGKGATPSKGQICRIAYRGWLYEGNKRGKLFDSADAKHAYGFPVGTGAVIPGWDEGVLGMKPGGKRVLIVPPALGYGSQGAGTDIPPNATLLFEMELLSVK